jgi:CubicO group peptidase (beta-lactamase class C family)
MNLKAWFCALAVLAGLVGPAQSLAPLPPQPAGVAFPTQAWPKGAPKVTDLAGLTAAVEAIVAKPDPIMGETRAVVIIQGGKLVMERYPPGYSALSRHVSWSSAKSITHALVGAAALQGLINPDAPMGHPVWGPGHPFALITWRQWLQMVDGQDWVEVGAPSVTANGSALALFGPGRLDVGRYCARRPVKAPAGQRWHYNTCGITLVAAALGRVVAPQGPPAARRAAFSAWMRAALFDPLGMTSATPEFDAQGTFLGGSLVYATGQDFARFGLLYLRDGMWAGRRVLPAGWVDFARTPQPAPDTDTYGAGFWITPPRGDGVGMRSLIIGEGMRDAFSAQGRAGQVVLVVPSKDLVIVRLGLFEDGRKSWDTLGDWMGALARRFPDRPAT